VQKRSSPCSASLDPRLVGDPVDTLTGAVFDRRLEFRLIGPLELWWFRHYDSSRSNQRFALGWGRTHDFERTLRFESDAITYGAPVGRSFRFPLLVHDGDQSATHGFILRRESRRIYQLFHHGEAAIEFELAESDQVARLKRLFRGRHQILFHHNARRRLERIVDSIGRRIAVEEEPNGRLLRLTLEAAGGRPAELLMEYQYDDRGNLVRTRNSSGNGYVFAYDSANRMVLQTGRKGFKFRFAYDEQGRCVKSTGDNDFFDVTLDYKAGRLTKVTRIDGGVWSYLFDPLGNLAEVKDPLGGSRKFLRDEAGRIAVELDQNQNATRYLYDQAGEAVAKIDPLGNQFPLPEDPNVPDPLDHRVACYPVEYEYGRLLEIEQISLPTQAQLRAFDLAAEAKRFIVCREREENIPAVEEFRVRPLGVLWWPSPEKGRIFNDLGKLVGQRDEFGRRRHWNYDASGNLSEFVDFDGGTWAYDYGAWHFLRGLKSPLGTEVRFTHTSTGEVASCTDPGGTCSEYRYDLNDHLIEVKRHGAVRETYARDAFGNLTAKYAGDGRELLKFEIGPGNLRTKRILASGDEHLFEYDQSGRYLVAATKKDSVQFDYDDAGNQVLEKRNGQGIVHRFRGRFKLSESLLFERFAARYEWLAGSTLVLRDPAGKSQKIRFLPHGIVERRFSNGSQEIAQYDGLGRCQLKSVERSDGRIWNRHYHWSGEGELRQIQDRPYGDTHCEYDPAHRLVRRVANGRVEEYGFDQAGNLIRQPGLDDVTLQEGNRLSTANGLGFTYNDRNHIAERQTPEGSVQYSYDSRDQLVRVGTPQGEWLAEYDALGRRTRKVWAGKTTEFFWNGDQLIAEVAPDGRLRFYIYADPLALTPLMFLEYGSLNAATESCRRYFIFADQIGTPISIEDDQGVEVWRARIEPFGRADIASSSRIEFNLRFPGHYYDVELALHYNRFRYYDPSLGRYLQSDPWGIAGGYNVYAYRANPLLEVDVRGLGEEETPAPKKPDEDEEGDKPLHDRKGWVDEYGEQKKVTGDGSVDRDHQPSKLAIKKAIKDDIDKRVAAGEMDPPTPAQMKEINDRIDKEATAVVVDHDVHKEGPTHGSKNKAQSEIDKQDLGAAAARDADAMVANAAQHDPDNVPAYQAAADKIKEQTHDSIMEKNRAIVDDVMNKDD
jgi:RHS repeat-associated protein